MKKVFKKAKISLKKVKKLNFCAIFLVFSVLGISGCNEPVQQAQEIDSSDFFSTLRSKATLIIRDGLADSRPQIRANCIEVVAATKRLELMPKVQFLLKDPFVPVRFAAAMAVGDTEYKLAEKTVKQLLKDPDKNVQIAAGYALSRTGKFDISKALRKSVGSKNLTVRANTVVLLGKSGSPKELKPLYWALQDPYSDDKVRFQAVEAIARLGDEQILSKIWPMLISIYADDRLMGIKALGALGTSQTRQILITKLDDDVLEVRLTAAGQLGRLGETIGQEQVLEVFTKNLTAGMDNEEKERVNVHTAMAIGHIATAELKVFLPQLLEDRSVFVRIAAAKAVFQYMKTK